MKFPIVRDVSIRLQLIDHSRYHWANYLIIQNPLEELEEAVKYHDIFKAYSLGLTLFESYAVKILHEDFDMNKVHVGKDIMDRINVQTLIVILYTNKIITKSEYDDMIKINSIRNNLIIHKDFTKELDVGTTINDKLH